MIILKIAISTEKNIVAAHFGRCPEYTIVTVESGRVVNKEVIPNPGHEPGFLPKYLGEMGISTIVAGGMGPRAQALFDEKNIQIITGISGTVDEVIKEYLVGRLKSGESTCEHH